MAWVKTRNGKHTGLYRDADGRERSAGTSSSKRAAQRAAEDMEAKLRAGTWIDPDLGKITFSDYFEQFWIVNRNLEVNSRETYWSHYRTALKPRFGETSLDRIKPSVVQGWVTDMRNEGVTPGTIKGEGTFSSVYWGQTHVPVELPNLKSVKWERNVEQDVATCTIELYNTAPLPVGTTPPDDYDWEQPGFYSPGRGSAGNRWGYADNKWGDLIRPNRLIRTYQGYGVNYAVAPEADTNLYPSGVWLIDRVGMSANGKLLTLECRDIGPHRSAIQPPARVGTGNERSECKTSWIVNGRSERRAGRELAVRRLGLTETRWIESEICPTLSAGFIRRETGAGGITDLNGNIITFWYR